MLCSNVIGLFLWVHIEIDVHKPEDGFGEFLEERLGQLKTNPVAPVVRIPGVSRGELVGRLSLIADEVVKFDDIITTGFHEQTLHGAPLDVVVCDRVGAGARESNADLIVGYIVTRNRRDLVSEPFEENPFFCVVHDSVIQNGVVVATESQVYPLTAALFYEIRTDHIIGC